MAEPQPFCDDSTPIVAPNGRLTSVVQAWAQANCIPLNVTIETTLKCNIRCVHCYNFDRDAPAAPPPAAPGCGERRELSRDEILALLDDVREAGCLFLSLTGGEVLTHPHLFDFLDRARALNLAVQLLSNGTLLRPGVVSRLAAYPNLLGVSLSLYGATAETHDAITQSPGSFRRTWDGAGRLRARGIAVRLKFLAMRQNAHEIERAMADATAAGLAYFVDLTVTARHDGTAGSLATRVSREQIEQLYRGPLRDLVPKGRHQIGDGNFACNCARGNCAISAYGDVQPCISVPMVAGNVRDRPFREIWTSSPMFQWIRGLRLADFKQCAPCPHKSWCSRSRGAAFTASGDYTGADPFVCEGAEVAHGLYPRP